jgi:hypothetical protein
MRSTDTSPEAHRVQIAILRAAGPARRAEMGLSMSANGRAVLRRNLRQRHPLASEQELTVQMVSLCYGKELAQQLAAWLSKRESGDSKFTS